MTGMPWPLLEVATRLLERDEREVVLGDLLETGEGGWSGLLGVLGLVVRRKLQLFRSWRPWAASFGLTLPGSLLLMGFSVSIASICERLADHKILIESPHAMHEAFIPLICRGLLLIGGSWVCGFVVGSVSRRTLWMSMASCCVPCLFCLVRFREPSLSKFCLFLFLLPAIWGVHQALRLTRISLTVAVFLAIAITALTILPTNSRGVWALNWALVWPAWYIVATALGETGKPDKAETADEVRRLEQ
jgi:hypothetical protein